MNEKRQAAPLRFWSLGGLTSYGDARELQLRLVEARARDRVPDTVLFVEHSPVVTRGRGLQHTGAPRPRHMPLPGPMPPGMAFAESERGGDLTYHGPGQLVVYPILKLEGVHGFAPRHDVAAFLRGFEGIVIDELNALGRGEFSAEARENASGVWIRSQGASGSLSMPGPLPDPRKIASVGIAIRRWVTYHGFAINCVNDLKPFHLISPCGFSPEVMTRLVDLLDAESPEARSLRDWDARGRADWEARLQRRISSAAGFPAQDIRSLPCASALLEVPVEAIA